VQGGRGGLTPQQAQRVYQSWNLHRRSVYHSYFHLPKIQLADLPELANAAGSLKQSPVSLLFKSVRVLRAVLRTTVLMTLMAAQQAA